MHHGTNSLNVAVEAGILLYHFMRGNEYARKPKQEARDKLQIQKSKLAAV
jgi:hypothetical protein